MPCTAVAERVSRNARRNAQANPLWYAKVCVPVYYYVLHAFEPLPTEKLGRRIATGAPQQHTFVPSNTRNTQRTNSESSTPNSIHAYTIYSSSHTQAFNSYPSCLILTLTRIANFGIILWLLFANRPPRVFGVHLIS